MLSTTLKLGYVNKEVAMSKCNEMKCHNRHGKAEDMNYKIMT